MEMLPPPFPIAGDREELELDAEIGQEEDADPEGRHHQRHHEDDAGDLIEDAVLAQGRDDSQRQ